jgi:hypothetical protein
VFVLAEPDDFAAAPDLGAELDGTFGQQAVGDGLGDAENVWMRGVQTLWRRLVDAGEEASERVLLAECEEAVQQTALIHHLDAAHVQPERPDVPGRLGLLLQHEHVYAVEPQLTRKHQAGRSAAGNDHVNHGSSFDTVHVSQLLAQSGASASSFTRRVPRTARRVPRRLDVPRGLPRDSPHVTTRVSCRCGRPRTADPATRQGSCRKPPGAL